MTNSEPEIVELIRSLSASGHSTEDIYKDLLNRGHKVEAIQRGFDSASGKTDKEDTAKKTIVVIISIATLLVGAGIFSFIASNWPKIGRPAKISTILAAMLSAQAVGWRLKEKHSLPKIGEGLIILGTVIYGAGIFLIAQMFNIRANWPDGFILWMIGSIAMALATEIFPLLYLAVILGVIALVGHPGILFLPGENPFLLTSLLLLLASTITTFVAGWLVRKKMPNQIREFY